MKILMIGLGSIGQRHVRNLRILLGADLEILALRTRGLGHVLNDRQQIDASEGLEETYDIRAFADLDEALAEKPDAVFICNPNSLHVPYALAAAKAGCHLFIEKPLGHTEEGVDELIAVVEEQKLAALVGFQLRFHPCVETVAGWLRDERIGLIIGARVVDAESLPAWHPYEDYRQSYAAREELGGGVILSRIHEIDYIFGFFGLPDRVLTLGGHLSDLEIDVEDVASSLFGYGGEHPFPLHLHQDMVAHQAQRGCTITGTTGLIDMNLLTGSVTLSTTDGQTERHDFSSFDRNQLFLNELTHFFACMRGESQPVVSLRDGRASLRMALAARESLRTGDVVTLNHDD